MQLGLPVDPVHDYVVVVQIALNHLDLRVWLSELLVVTVSAENNYLEMLGEVSQPVNGADANPHIVDWLLRLKIAVVRRRVRLLLEVLA